MHDANGKWAFRPPTGRVEECRAKFLEGREQMLMGSAGKSKETKCRHAAYLTKGMVAATS